MHSPRLAHPEQAADFVKQVIEESTDGANMMRLDTTDLRR
jgi:hypothetical protein